MELELTPVAQAEYQELSELWEASVRATHQFVRPEDVEFYKALLPGYFPAVRLTAARDAAGRILAFLGTKDGNIEMLFVHPSYRGRGIGSRLVRHAVAQLGCTRVDVNEQNEQAVGFYERMGFAVESRSETDAEGFPYPILHLVLPGCACGASE
ncbi:MAG: GNAT family N-acetyltransferase [Rikenellaceae bacterium]|nr:GNAT family N-acetyltransferase [Rikenellaceae bacterium]